MKNERDIENQLHKKFKELFDNEFDCYTMNRIYDDEKAMSENKFIEVMTELYKEIFEIVKFCMKNGISLSHAELKNEK